MNRNDATAILCDENEDAEASLEYLDLHRPAGVTCDEILEEVIQYADADELDILGRKFFCLVRQGGTAMVNGMGASDPETDECFRSRILSYMGVKPKAAGHVHVWKRYEGFTDVYDYCTGCDEKRR